MAAAMTGGRRSESNRSWVSPCTPMSWPAAVMARSTSGAWRTFSPRTKNVARAPLAASAWRTAGVDAGSGPSSKVSATSGREGFPRQITGANRASRGVMTPATSHSRYAAGTASARNDQDEPSKGSPAATPIAMTVLATKSARPSDLMPTPGAPTSGPMRPRWYMRLMVAAIRSSPEPMTQLRRPRPRVATSSAMAATGIPAGA